MQAPLSWSSFLHYFLSLNIGTYVIYVVKLFHSNGLEKVDHYTQAALAPAPSIFAWSSHFRIWPMSAKNRISFKWDWSAYMSNIIKKRNQYYIIITTVLFGQLVCLHDIVNKNCWSRQTFSPANSSPPCLWYIAIISLAPPFVQDSSCNLWCHYL